jgi:hypothetical protein
MSVSREERMARAMSVSREERMARAMSVSVRTGRIASRG